MSDASTPTSFMASSRFPADVASATGGRGVPSGRTERRQLDLLSGVEHMMTPEERAAIKIQSLARATLSRRLFTSPRRKLIRQAGANVASKLSEGIFRSLQVWLLRLGWSKASGILLSTFMAGYVAQKRLGKKITHLEAVMVVSRNTTTANSLQFDDLCATHLCSDKPLEDVFSDVAARRSLCKAVARTGWTPTPTAVARASVPAVQWFTRKVQGLLRQERPSVDGPDTAHVDETIELNVLQQLSLVEANEILDDARHFLQSLFSAGTFAMLGNGPVVEMDFVFTLMFMPPQATASDRSQATQPSRKGHRLTLVAMPEDGFERASRSDLYLLNKRDLSSLASASSKEVSLAWQAVHALATRGNEGHDIDRVSLFVPGHSKSSSVRKSRRGRLLSSGASLLSRL